MMWRARLDRRSQDHAGSRIASIHCRGRGRRNCEHALKAWSVRRRCRDSKGLLVGEGMEPAALAEIRSLVAADRDVEHVGSLLSLYLGPDDVLLAIELRVLPQTSLTDLRSAIARIKKSIQQRYPRVRHVFLDT